MYTGYKYKLCISAGASRTIHVVRNGGTQPQPKYLLKSAFSILSSSMLPLCASHRLVCGFVLASAISLHAKRQWLYPQTGIHDANAKTLDRPSKPVAHGNTRFGLPFWASRPMAIGRSKARCHYPAWSACGWMADGWRMAVTLQRRDCRDWGCIYHAALGADNCSPGNEARKLPAP